MKSGLLGGFLQLPRQNWYNPFLSSWDRDQENSAFVGQELFRQAYSAPPDLYRPSSEQAKRADPNMTDEGHTISAWVLVVCGSAEATNESGWSNGSGQGVPARPGSGRTGHPPGRRSWRTGG